jgi:hypothetical protein
MSIHEAITWFTGDYYPKHQKWDYLQTRLEESGHTGFEYCVFILFYEDGKKKPVHLTYMNKLCNEDTFAQFLNHKKTARTMARTEMSTARKTFRDHKALGLSTQQILNIPGVHLNSIACVEEVTRAAVEEGFDASGIYEKNRMGAAILLLGTPEYIVFAPYLFKLLKMEDMDVFRLFRVDV